MEKSGREYLTGSIMLSRSKDGSSPEEYFIKSVIGEGGSTVCYEATRILKDGIVETGKLKEFYPVDSVVGNRAWYYSLKRLSNGQLVPGAGTIRKFDEMCEDYLSTYKLLRRVMVDNPQNEILKGYIQHGEILYGSMEYDHAELSDLPKPTVYIWSPGVPGKGFDVYLSEIKKNPQKNPEGRLQDILCVMDTLTDCIKALHTAGLLHMDIKPSNFLVQYDSDFEIKPNNISLFDINTLCSIESEFLRISGTKGYCAPEVLKGKADNRSDIYSLGAMLFHALVIAKEVPDALYEDCYYSSIAQLVKHSALFEASEINSDAIFMSKICKILEKCLAKDPRKRYQSCSELKSDIDKARKRLNKMLWTPIEKSKEGVAEPVIVIQKLLYEHPLYEAVEDGADDINVLVLGSGTYSHKFMDVCLQAGQMSGVHLNITAVSDEPEEDKTAYLRFRPAISEFVNVNGSLQGKENLAYAVLNFKGVDETPEGTDSKLRFSRNTQLNQELVQHLIQSAALKNEEYHYVFVTLGEDRISHFVARLCSDGIRDCWGRVCPVCYVSKKLKKGRKGDLLNKLYPVCINERVDVAAIDKRLGEMAFNTHISWKDTMNMDVTKERAEFFEGQSEKSRYNRMASISFALSIKYKLHSVQIECEDLLEAALLFSKNILEARFSNEEARKKFDRLVDLEHRRWLLDRAVEGWSAPRDANGKLKLEECVVRGSVKDNVNRTHPCMVHGSETSPLSSPDYFADHYARWNEGEIDPELDELDRMSIELHRCFRRQAEQLKKGGSFHNSDLLFIQNLIPGDCSEAERAFKQFRFALKNIMNGVESYSRQYDYYQDELKASLKVLPNDSRSKIEERLTVLKHAFFPVIESNLYRDYKANDEVLIKKIPFILTYQYKPAMAMAFEDGKHQNGRNEAVFVNVAAATILSPEKIRFLYCYNHTSDIDLLIRKLDAVLNYFGKRNVRSGIELMIACMKEVSDRDREHLQEELSRLKMDYQNSNGNAWFEQEVIYDVDDYAEAAEAFAEYLKENPVDLYDGGNMLFPSVYDNAMFIKQITDKNIPYFEFDWRKKEFSKRIGCEYLRFVKDASFIRIGDMFALMNAVDNRFNLPEFADDYEILWKIYTGEYLKFKKFENGVGNWNRLCMCLEKYEADQKPLAKTVVSINENISYKNLTYFLPEYTFSTVKMLVQKLMEYEIVEKDSDFVKYTSDTCRLDLKINEEYETFLNEVFTNPHMLLPYYGIEVNKYRTYQVDYVEIRCSRLEVNGVNLDFEGSGHGKFLYQVLEQLKEHHFISQLTGDRNNPVEVSFVYSSPRIKKLLTSAGEILEIYAYYDVLKTGYFDDVASGYEFNWESGGVKNELDLVLTKGFKSIMVECKAVVELKLDYYHKLHSLADQFGIGTTKVLLGNTYAHSDTVSELNAVQRSRGSQLSIQTISSEDEIVNIGQTLIRLMEAT